MSKENQEFFKLLKCSNELIKNKKSLFKEYPEKSKKLSQQIVSCFLGLKSTKNVVLPTRFASQFVVFYAFYINIVFFNTMPQAALIDTQQLGGPHLNPAGFF